MTPLKIAILAQLASPTIANRLAPELRQRGHIVDIIDLSTTPEVDVTTSPEVQNLAEYDVVYYRSGLTPEINPARIIALEAFLDDHAIKTVNLHYTEHPDANSKTYEAQLAKAHGLRIPNSIYTHMDFSTFETELGLPFIIKTDQGTKGNGVHLIADESRFIEVKNYYPNTKLLFQEFIQHDFEYRVHVIAGDTVCIYKKAPATGDFRSNEAQGGEMIQDDQLYTSTLEKLAAVTYTAFGFEMFVADFMLHKETSQFYFTEINLNPAWEHNDQLVTGIDLISLTADYLEKICT